MKHPSEKPADGQRVPSQQQLIFPLLEHLRSAGPTTAKAAASALAERFTVPAEDRDRTVQSADGQRSAWWRRHVRFAHLKAVKLGFTAPGPRGSWQATDEGLQGLAEARAVVSVRMSEPSPGQPRCLQICVDVGIPTVHTLIRGDARDLSWIGEGEIGAVISSIPYFDVRDYGNDVGQLATCSSYDTFLDEMTKVLGEMFRVLIPGGRAALNVGDVLRGRKKHGTHHVLPLSADMIVRGRSVGFATLNGIIWNKRSNVTFEQGGAGTLGKPGQPNNAIQLEAEHLLFLRKPGPYRSPTPAQRDAARITKEEHDTWHRQIWSDVPGARSTQAHPAPYPVEIPYRLARMLSFPGDTILDTFVGSGTTAIAAAKAGRNSIGVDINPAYIDAAIARVPAAIDSLLRKPAPNEMPYGSRFSQTGFA